MTWVRRLSGLGLAAAALAGGAVAASASSSPHAYIAYLRGGDKGPTTVWLANPDGTHAHRLATGDEALLSTNGGYVAVERYASSGASLELYSTSGKLVAGYFDAAKDTATALQWSANSKYLLTALASKSTKAVGTGALTLIDMSTRTSRSVVSGAISGASFSPNSASIVFGRASSVQLTSPVDLYTARVAGGAPTRLTRNGNSFDPLWLPTGIVFDRATSRGADKAPIFQLWIDSSGKLRQLTHMRVPSLLDGLSPLDGSRDGNRLIAEYTGEDTSYAWTVQLSPLRIQVLKVAGKQVQGGQISADGRRLLVDVGGFEQSADYGEVESVAFGGGTPTRLDRGAQPSWSN